MVATYTRESRDFDFVPSIGSSIVIGRYGPDGVTIADLTNLDIETCRITEIFTNKVTTHSGSNGATLRTRVGSDWLFSATLSFPAGIVGGSLREKHIEPLLGSIRSVAVRFNIGDPDFWTNRDLEVRSLRATKCLLSQVEHVLDSTGTEVAQVNLAGEGNSLLWTYLDDVAKYPQIWLV